MPNPSISIVMPVYNATAFLETGIAGIRAQTFKDWELIAVDDGSSDGSREMIEKLCAGMEQPLQLVTQENKGGFGARNTGLDHVRGDYIAFFDCDDEWYPHHLQDCLTQLEAVSEVDWVFAANKIVDLTTDKTVEESNFYEQGKERPLLKLKYKKIGDLHLIEDKDAARCQILNGLNCGQQFSVIRKKVFDGYRFRADYRNEGADQVSVIRSLARGFKFGYLKDVHGIYCIHDNNASAGCKGAALEKYVRLRTALIRGFEEVRKEEKLSARESKAIDERIASEQFWNIGYNIFWLGGRRAEALKRYVKGLAITPGNIKMWKTLAGALFKPTPKLTS